MTGAGAVQRITLLGQDCAFSTIVLERLLAAGVPVTRLGVAVRDTGPARSPPRSIVEQHPPGSLLRVATEASIRIDRVHRRNLGDTLLAGDADLLVSACFPLIVPAQALSGMHAGALNLHPSLLPAYRGPTPVFWQLRAGEQCSGITVHRLGTVVDAGDIVTQAAMALPPGISAQALGARLAARGAELLLDALPEYLDGSLLPAPQLPAGASYFSWPGPDAFVFGTDWSARRAFTFVRGTRAWGQHYTVRTPDGPLLIDAALAYSTGEATADGRAIPGCIGPDGETVRIRFAPGVLYARLATRG